MEVHPDVHAILTILAEQTELMLQLLRKEEELNRDSIALQIAMHERHEHSRHPNEEQRQTEAELLRMDRNRLLIAIGTNAKRIEAILKNFNLERPLSGDEGDSEIGEGDSPPEGDSPFGSR